MSDLDYILVDSDIHKNINIMLDSLFQEPVINNYTHTPVPDDKSMIDITDITDINNESVYDKYIFISDSVYSIINELGIFLLQYTEIVRFLETKSKVRILNLLDSKIRCLEALNLVRYICKHYYPDSKTIFIITNNSNICNINIQKSIIFRAIEIIILEVYNSNINNYTPIISETIDSYKRSYAVNLVSTKFNIPYETVDLFLTSVYTLEYRKVINKNVINSLNFEIDSDMTEIKNICKFQKYNSVRLLYGICAQYNYLISKSFENKKIILKSVTDVISLLQTPLFESLFK
jgi:hypothetical protein